MSEIIVGEAFVLPLKSIDYHNGIVDGNGFGVLFSDLLEYEKKALCHAVNNHDSMQDQITQLEKDKAELVDALKLVNIANNMSNVTGWDKVMESLK